MNRSNQLIVIAMGTQFTYNKSMIWTPGKIKKLRLKLELSPQTFGNLIGVSKRYVNYLESGDRKPGKTLEILLKRIEEELKGKGGEKDEKRDI